MHILDCPHIVEEICADLYGRDLAACVVASRRFFNPAVCALYNSVTPKQLDRILSMPLTCRSTLYRGSVRHIIHAPSIESMFIHTAALPFVETYQVKNNYGFGETTSFDLVIHLERSLAPGPTVLVHYRGVAVTVVDNVHGSLTDLWLGPRVRLPAKATSIHLHNDLCIPKLLKSEACKFVKRLLIDLDKESSLPDFSLFFTRACSTLTELTVLNQGQDVFDTIALCCTRLVKLVWEGDRYKPGLDLSQTLKALSKTTSLEELHLGWFSSIGSGGWLPRTATELRSPTFKRMRKVGLDLPCTYVWSLLGLSLEYFPLACKITIEDGLEDVLRSARESIYEHVFAEYGWSHLAKNSELASSV